MRPLADWLSLRAAAARRLLGLRRARKHLVAGGQPVLGRCLQQQQWQVDHRRSREHRAEPGLGAVRQLGALRPAGEREGEGGAAAHHLRRLAVHRQRRLAPERADLRLGARRDQPEYRGADGPVRLSVGDPACGRSSGSSATRARRPRHRTSARIPRWSASTTPSTDTSSPALPISWTSRTTLRAIPRTPTVFGRPGASRCRMKSRWDIPSPTRSRPTPPTTRRTTTPTTAGRISTSSEKVSVCSASPTSTWGATTERPCSEPHWRRPTSSTALRTHS